MRSCETVGEMNVFLNRRGIRGTTAPMWRQFLKQLIGKLPKINGVSISMPNTCLSFTCPFQNAFRSAFKLH